MCTFNCVSNMIIAVYVALNSHCIAVYINNKSSITCDQVCSRVNGKPRSCVQHCICHFSRTIFSYVVFELTAFINSDAPLFDNLCGDLCR